MRKVYYKRMRKAALTLSCAALLFVPGASLPQQRPQSTAMRTSALDSHEGMTVAAEPLTDAEQYKPAFPKKNPYSSGIIAIARIMRLSSAGLTGRPLRSLGGGIRSDRCLWSISIGDCTSNGSASVTHPTIFFRRYY